MALVQHNPRIILNECRAKLSTQVAKSTLRGKEEERTTISSGGPSSALSLLHIAKRIELCKKMKAQDWSKVFLTDECSIWMNSGIFGVEFR